MVPAHRIAALASPLPLLTPLLAPLLVSLVLLAGCGSEMGEGSQLVGQRCFSDSSCVRGLVCHQRQCVPPAPVRVDATDAGADAAPIEDASPGDATLDIGLPPDGGDGGDGGGDCQAGERRCTDATGFVLCVEAQDGTTSFVRFSCDEGFACEAGECQRPGICVDRDGDGFEGYDPFVCPTGTDCHDEAPGAHPGAPERCSTVEDDNCDGFVNEGCPPLEWCCPGGCADGEFCNTACSCEAFEANACQSQNQPCEIEGPSGDYYCRALGDEETMRCYGLCDRVGSDTDATCPEPDSVCSSIEQGGSDICLSTCDPEVGCGSDALGCLPSDNVERGGTCRPGDPDAQIGDPCDQDDFGGCGSEAFCVQLPGMNQARCVEACRAFTAPEGTTDCSQGHCLPATLGVALCVPDNGSTGNQQCSSVGRSACGEDAVGCMLRPNGQARCTQLCRLNQGNVDCDGPRECVDIGQGDIGACRPPAP